MLDAIPICTKCIACRDERFIVDAMGTLRNRASLAHPNEELLDHEEGLLVINLARSLLRFLDAKIGKRWMNGLIDLRIISLLGMAPKIFQRFMSTDLLP
jgi:hypothetical protein